MKTTILVLLLFSGVSVYSQATILEVSGCSNTTFNGTYVQDENMGDCGCYEGINGVIFASGGFWSFTDASTDCGTLGNGISTAIATVAADPNACDITFASGLTGCTFTTRIAVPTMSQWGVIVLALSLSIFGMLASRGRIFQFATK